MNPKMMKTAQKIDTVLKIFQCIMAVSAVILLGFLLITAASGRSVVENASYYLQLDFVKLHFTKKYISTMNVDTSFALMSMVVSLLDLLMALFVCKMIRSILKPMRLGRPFDGNVPKNLKIIGWGIIVYGVLEQAAKIYGNTCAVQELKLPNIFNSQYLSNVSFEFNFEFTFLIIAAFVFLLSYIFSYGQKLQQESDETL